MLSTPTYARSLSFSFRTPLIASCLCAQCSFVEHRSFKVIYRRYASLFFLVGVDGDEVGSPRVYSERLTAQPTSSVLYVGKAGVGLGYAVALHSYSY